MKQLLTLLTIFFFFGCQAQKIDKFNLGFENQTNIENLSDGWFMWGNYDLTIDSLSYSGQKAGKITSDATGSSFGSIAYRIPSKYKGKSIQLDGWMKTKDVQNGHAGLLLRIDGENGSLEFNNMKNQQITGTKDWKKYSITLNYPEEAQTIFVAGILTGKGEVWFDDFTLSIDGKDIQTLQETEIKLTKAQLDKEFDNGSHIEIPALTPQLITNLELLGKVWGFLKYHHPAIAKGDYNWDYELFRFLPEYLEVMDTKKRDTALIHWIDQFGAIKKCSNCKPVDNNAFLKPDLDWIDPLSTTLKSKLSSIYQNRNQEKHHYIEMAPGVGNPIFKNESAYKNISYPDEGFRLLSLYRYWNMIQYYFPYKHLTDKDWNLVLEEYIPIFINAKNELTYELAALKIIGEIKDTHANLWRGGNKINEWKGEYYPPLKVRFLENQLVITAFYTLELQGKTELEIGDVITKINGKSIQQLIKEKSDYYPASNQPTRLRNLSSDLLRSTSDKIDIQFLDKNATLKSETLQLYSKELLFMSYESKSNNTELKKNDDLCYKMLDQNIGYLTLASIQNEDFSKIKEEFSETKGIIIDIRNYPSAFAPFRLGSFFVDSPTPFVKFTKGNIGNPGEFTFTEKLEIPSGKKYYNGKLIVIVNEISQSQAEYTAMAFRAGDNTTIIGSTTAGADGNVSRIPLPGGLQTMISGIGVYYPDGKETQRVGIVPDIVVQPTIEGIRAGKDELLEKAIDLILNE